LEATKDIRGMAKDDALARLDRLQSALMTTIDTGVAGLDRTISLAQSEIAGVEYYLYDGPRDERNRPFCAALTGHWVTSEELARLRNGQIEPAAIYGGGYNCRHRWVALDLDETETEPHYTGPWEW